MSKDWIAVRASGSEIIGSIFYPVPGVYETYGVRRVRFVVHLDGTDFEVAPGIQYSNDGFTWYDTGGELQHAGIYNVYNGKQENGTTDGLAWIKAATTGGGPDAPASNRTVLATWIEAPGGFRTRSNANAGTVLTERLFCRFGVFVKRQAAASDSPRGGRVALEVEVEPNEARSLTVGPVFIPTGGGDGVAPNVVVTPLTPWMSTADIASVRASWEIESIDDAEVRLGWQSSNDGVNVIDNEDIGALSWVSQQGLTFGTTFASFSSASGKLFVRFTGHARNKTATDTKVRGLVVELRVDLRP